MFGEEGGLSAGERVSIARVAEAAAREAGEILLEHLGRLEPSQITTKSAARDLVTAADVACCFGAISASAAGAALPAIARAGDGSKWRSHSGAVTQEQSHASTKTNDYYVF